MATSQRITNHSWYMKQMTVVSNDSNCIASNEDTMSVHGSSDNKDLKIVYNVKNNDTSSTTIYAIYTRKRRPSI